MAYIPIYKRDEIYKWTLNIWPFRIYTRYCYKRLYNILYMKKYIDESQIYDVFKRVGIPCDALEIFGIPEPELPANCYIIRLQHWSSTRFSIYVNKDGYIYDITRG